jgi:hypothetical protein
MTLTPFTLRAALRLSRLRWLTHLGSLVLMACVMAASTGTAWSVSPCSVDTVPIQIMTPGSSGSRIMHSAVEISNALPHFRAFVTAVTEHIAARLTKDKLCMDSAESKERSLLQFVHWPLFVGYEYLVPEPLPGGYGGVYGDCLISSPWIDITFKREPVPWIRGIVYWNERQLLADQAALSGARNVLPGMVMPLKLKELGRFLDEYEDTEFPFSRKSAVKPIEERVPPDILWLLRRSGHRPGRSGFFGDFGKDVSHAMKKATEKGAKGYTKLVIALVDRCFAFGGAYFHYRSILDISDPVLLGQYKVSMSPRR